MAPASPATVTPSSISASTSTRRAAFSCSLLRLPPVKRWIAARQKEGRIWLVCVTVAPIFALFVLGFVFILNEQIFKGIDSFMEHPSTE